VKKIKKEKFMLFADLLVALFIGLVIVGVASYAFNTKGPWDSFLWFFVVVALFAWAGGVWVTPFGPSWGGIGWLPILFMGILAAVLLTAASPKSYHRLIRGKNGRPAFPGKNVIAVDLFFWILILCLLFFGSSHYYWYPRI
jgi:hypothetical protein